MPLETVSRGTATSFLGAPPCPPPFPRPLTTKKEPLRGSKESPRTRSHPEPSSDSESADTANTSDDSCPGVVEDEEMQREEPEMKKPVDSNQEPMPVMALIPLPTNNAPVRPEPPTRGHRLPEDWMPPLDVVEQMRAECPYVDQALELRKFRDYWLEKVGRDCTKLTWKGTYRNWIRKAASDNPRSGNGQERHGLSAVDEKALGWQGVGR